MVHCSCLPIRTKKIHFRNLNSGRLSITSSTQLSFKTPSGKRYSFKKKPSLKLTTQIHSEPTIGALTNSQPWQKMSSAKLTSLFKQTHQSFQDQAQKLWMTLQLERLTGANKGLSGQLKIKDIVVHAGHFLPQVDCKG